MRRSTRKRAAEEAGDLQNPSSDLGAEAAKPSTEPVGGSASNGASVDSVPIFEDARAARCQMLGRSNGKAAKQRKLAGKARQQLAAAAHQSGCWSGAPELSNVVDELEACRLVIFTAALPQAAELSTVECNKWRQVDDGATHIRNVPLGFESKKWDTHTRDSFELHDRSGQQ